ncbi:MAG TPA: aminotransferase class V-fold PLP-dependent enzyme [Candidatus Sulfomarinibacteraceae bacterium]|nr:aminotransferase class V-fold PLP-dependent enzyme [Candidatus Sulfomarinibacteraceae bacterium]
MKQPLEAHFTPFRRQIVGRRATFQTTYGEMPLVYADWTASGRLYAPIEQTMSEAVAPYVGNTHTETSFTGTLMTRAYHEAREAIKHHVNAGPDDVLIAEGSGMTTVVNKLQRMLGLRIPEQLRSYCHIPEDRRPVVFVTHMEHHSNHTSWLETIADVEVLPPNEDGLVDPHTLSQRLPAYGDRPLKIGAFTACSNVTGIETPYAELARIMHRHGGYCFVDFAASAPYVDIDMHPDDPQARLDAIYFSPHKFLGGPGTPGVLVFHGSLYGLRVPDRPGGGTVNWTNPWQGRSYIDDIEAREDGGTPAFLQTIRAALAIRLKETMGTEAMRAREEELLPRLFAGLRAVPGLHILADHVEQRLGIVSFYVENIHYNLLVKLLNDRYGIQVRGGCSCAGTYGHYLLNVSRRQSEQITSRIDQGDLSQKPGWVRVSIHPTTTDEELSYIVDAVGEIVSNVDEWSEDYVYLPHQNEFKHRRAQEADGPLAQWAELALGATPETASAHEL